MVTINASRLYLSCKINNMCENKYLFWYKFNVVFVQSSIESIATVQAD